jgi:hypothetical protein
MTTFVDSRCHGEQGDWEGKPVWENEAGLQLWWRQDQSHWRIGKTGDHYFIAHVEPPVDDVPPQEGWELATDRRTCEPHRGLQGPVPDVMVITGAMALLRRRAV